MPRTKLRPNVSPATDAPRPSATSGFAPRQTRPCDATRSRSRLPLTASDPSARARSSASRSRLRSSPRIAERQCSKPFARWSERRRCPCPARGRGAVVPAAFGPGPKGSRTWALRVLAAVLEDARCGIVVQEDHRNAGADQVWKAERRRDVVVASQQAVQPLVLFEPEAGFDGVRVLGVQGALVGIRGLVLAGDLQGGEHGASLGAVAAGGCSVERVAEG